VRADGLSAVLGPVLNDPRVVLAALVDVDSGMVLDACAPERPGARYWGADLEATGAGHAELARIALGLPGRAGADPDGDELVASAGPGRHHLVLALPDPHGGRLALSVVVEGSRRLANKVLRRLRAVPRETLTAGPTAVRRPGTGGWVTPPGAVAPPDDRIGSWPDGRPDERAVFDHRPPGSLLSGVPGPAPAGLPDRAGHGGFPHGFAGGFPSGPGGNGEDHLDRRLERLDRAAELRLDPLAGRPADHGPDGPRPDGPRPDPPGDHPGGPRPFPAARPAAPFDARADQPPADEPFALRVQIGPARHPAPGGLFDPVSGNSGSGGFGPVGHPAARAEPLGSGPAPGGTPIGLADPPGAPRPAPRPALGPDPLPEPGTEPSARHPRPPAPPSALPPGRPG
jgi:hypothetical protein